MKECPKCGEGGRKVSSVTVEAHTVEGRRRSLDDLDGWRFCRTSSCDVGYFDAGRQRVLVDQMTTVPFQKSDSPERLVCFCFGHTVAAVAQDAVINGESAIKAAITEACRSGLDACALKNPEGVCCLGNVAAVTRDMGQGSGGPKEACGTETDGFCCPPEEPPSAPAGPASSERRGFAAAAGALGTAALSSACCWLPLLFMGLGVSSAGVGAFFDAWRVPFLAVSSGLLVLGFYLTYFREPGCESGAACAATPPRGGRKNRATLWFAAIGVATFAFFPEAVTVLAGDGLEPAAQAAPAEISVVYTVEGMGCGGCASSVKTALEQVDGVASVSVSFEAGEATVAWKTAPDDSKVIRVLTEMGYRGARKAAR